MPEGISRPLLLGKGAEGDVYRAWQEPPGRVVVVKRSRDAEGARRLGREARLLSNLAGVPVPGLLAFQEEPRNSALVLEWLDGVSLDEIGMAGLTEEQRRALLLETVRAVARLHGAGIVHGDLSRANLLAHARGGIEIVDLGVARRVAETLPTGLGAWEVVAPEALKGELPGQAADVYALGCLALQIWCLVPDQAGTSRTVWCEMGASGALAALATSIHPLLEAAMSPDPARRPGNAQDMLRELQRDWIWILWPGKELQDAFQKREESLLEHGVTAAIQRRDWEEAWNLQKMRVEIAVDPEPLLPQLSRLSRRRLGQARRRWLPWVLAGIVLAMLGAVVFLRLGRPDPQRNLSHLVDSSHADERRDESDLFPVGPIREPRLLPYAIGPQPPDARLWIDGDPEEMPDDDTLWMEPGDYHIEVRDASGSLLRDTTIRFHPRNRPGKRAGVRFR
jgi:tRNA A-37 threonylcarbamoyl transferase component Bud32